MSFINKTSLSTNVPCFEAYRGAWLVKPTKTSRGALVCEASVVFFMQLISRVTFGTTIPIC